MVYVFNPNLNTEVLRESICPGKTYSCITENEVKLYPNTELVKEGTAGYKSIWKRFGVESK